MTTIGSSEGTPTDWSILNAMTQSVTRTAPGASVAFTVASADAILHHASTPGSEESTPDTLYLTHCMTKPIMAAALTKLFVGAGLDLHCRVISWLPDFAANGKGEVTPWHLLTHTSGLDESSFETLYRHRRPVDEFYRAASSACLSFRPGTHGEYCHLSFFVMAELIERIDGRSYDVFLRDEVLAPLGMNDTSFRPDPHRSNLPDFNFPDVEALEFLFGLKAPSSGLWSSAADLVRFGRAFLDAPCAIVPDEVKAQMMRYQTPNVLASSVAQLAWPAGLGWFKKGIANVKGSSERVVTHRGGSGSLIWVDPGHDLVFVYRCSRPEVPGAVGLRALNTVYQGLTIRPLA